MATKIGGPRSYPDFVEIGESSWEVRFVRKFHTAGMTGECDPSHCRVYIRLRQSRLETFKTFFHECIHGIEEEYDIQIDHDYLHVLDQMLGRAASENLYGFRNLMAEFCAPAGFHGLVEAVCEVTLEKFRRAYERDLDRGVLSQLVEALAHFLIVNFSQVQKIVHPGIR